MFKKIFTIVFLGIILVTCSSQFLDASEIGRDSIIEPIAWVQSVYRGTASWIGSLFSSKKEGPGFLARQGLDLMQTMGDEAIEMTNPGSERKPPGKTAKIIGNVAKLTEKQAIELWKSGQIHAMRDNLTGLLAEDTEQTRKLKKFVTDNGAELIAGWGAQGRKELWKFAGIAIIVTAGLAATYFGSRILWNHFERQLTTPKLAIESSEKNLWQRAKGFFVTEDQLPEMVFAPDLAKRLHNIVATTKSIRKKIQEGQKNVRYRNLLLSGPSGTGKTMFGRMLAHASGMEYVIITGASFSQYKGGQGVTEMNKLFEWAKGSKEGLVIFIDECESFLGGRLGSDVTSDAYQLITNFLNHTGTRSSQFMIVFSTNHPELLDPAIPSRIDDAVEIKLPDVTERAKILRLYRDKLLLDPTQNTAVFIESVKQHLDDSVTEKIAQKTVGLSGRELSGIINMLITDASVTESGLLTSELVTNAVDLATKKNRDFATKLKIPAKQLPAAAQAA